MIALRVVVIAVVALAVVVGAVVYFSPTLLLNAVTSRKGYTVRRDIAYGDLPRQKLDLYLPDKGADSAPLIVFFYGSAWRDGEKGIYRFVAQPFASRGFMVAVPDHRLYPEVTYPGFVEDGAAAVAYLWRTLRLPDGSPRRLILIGHSSGAHIAALLTLDERYLAKAGLPSGAIERTVGISGPYDFLPLKTPQTKAIFPEALREASQPIRYVDGTEAPMLLLTGDSDTTVGPGNTTRLAAKIREKGGVVTVALYPGVGHIGAIAALAEALPFAKPPVRDDILAFIAAGPRP
jgi:acetyl esterase/lipase